jgi:hypothetical protein
MIKIGDYCKIVHCKLSGDLKYEGTYGKVTAMHFNGSIVTLDITGNRLWLQDEITCLTEHDLLLVKIKEKEIGSI